MYTKLLQRLGALLFLLLPAPAWALTNRTWTVNTGRRISFTEFVSNMILYLSYLIGFVTTTLFLVGALYVVISAGNPTRMETGRKLMIESLKGMAIVLGSYGILRTVTFIVVNSA
jgi:hypothetical protein